MKFKALIFAFLIVSTAVFAQSSEDSDIVTVNYVRNNATESENAGSASETTEAQGSDQSEVMARQIEVNQVE